MGVAVRGGGGVVGERVGEGNRVAEDGGGAEQKEEQEDGGGRDLKLK